MKATLFALSALFIYAVANTIIEKKLSNVSPLANTTGLYIVLLIMSLPLIIFREPLGIKLTMPQGNEIWLLAVVAFLFFFADLAWFQAYHTEGARLEQITATFLAFPIMIAMMKGVSNGALPTRSDMLSWAIVAVGLIISIRQPLK